MMGHVGEAHIHRTSDRAAGRRPLRLAIARRRAPTRAGAEKFLTEIRIGEATALVVPWREDRPALHAPLAEAA